MPWLHPKNFMIFDDVQYLSGTTHRVSKEGVQLKVKPTYLDIIAADAPDPMDRISEGEGFEIKTIIIDGLDPGPEIKTQQVVKVQGKNVELEVALPDGTIEVQRFFNVEMSENYDLSFKQGELFFLPVLFESVATSTLQVGKYEQLQTETGENLLDETGDDLIGFVST